MKPSQILLYAVLLPFAQAYPRLKFHHWFPQYEQHWLGSARDPACALKLHAYYTSNRTECRNPCACAADCILQNVTGTMQSDFASAQVILGLVPSVLMFIGPSVAETAALSTSRPALAILLALGTPTINVLRLSTQVDVREPLQRPTAKALGRLLDWRRRRRSGLVRGGLRGVGYAVALAAIANNAQNAMYLDLRTISGWKCSHVLLPLAWSLACIVVHVPSMITVRLRKQDVPAGGRKSSIQASRARRQVIRGESTVASEILFAVASVFAIGHLVFGIVELSSLVFISAREALTTSGRFLLSVFACQCVLVLELAEMRRELS